MAAQTTLKVLSQNVRLIKSKARKAAVLDYIKNLGADIYCLKECGITKPVGEHKWVEGDHVWSGSTQPKLWSRNSARQ